MAAPAHRTGSVVSGDVTIFYRVFGKPGGAPVLIMHGANYFDSWDWMEVADGIATLENQEGQRTAALGSVLPGAGRVLSIRRTGAGCSTSGMSRVSVGCGHGSMQSSRRIWRAGHDSRGVPPAR